MRIVTDTASLFSPEEGRALGVEVVPACAVIDGQVYRDFEDISSEEFLQKIEAGAVPTTSQPSVGDYMDAFEGEDEVLFLSIGDGLSGGYQNAMGVKSTMEGGNHIHVVDTKTLAGPQHYLVEKALRLRQEGKDIKTIVKELSQSIERSVSFVIPSDFEFLKRSGRLIPLAAKIGSMIKIVPVMTQTEDMRRIRPFVITRSKKKAVEAIVGHLKELGVDKDYVISVAHAGVLDQAKAVVEQLRTHFADTKMELYALSPALITHGGPGSITIQAVRK